MAHTGLLFFRHCLIPKPKSSPPSRQKEPAILTSTAPCRESQITCAQSRRSLFGAFHVHGLQERSINWDTNLCTLDGVAIAKGSPEGSPAQVTILLLFRTVVSVIEDPEICLGPLPCACTGERPGLKLLRTLASRPSGSVDAAELQQNTDALQSGLIAAQAKARGQTNF